MDLEFQSSSVFRFKRKIASGGLADVSLYTKVTEGLPEQEVVIKTVKADGDLDELINDGARLSRLKHSNIVSTFGYERLAENKVGLILEYIPGKTLKEITGALSVQDRYLVAPYLVRTVTKAMAAAHRQGIIHGDLSSRNILVSRQGIIKLSDFGLARSCAERNAKSWRGSIDYWPPERWTGQPHEKSSDVFALGVLAFEILSGSNILSTKSAHLTFTNLQKFLSSEPWKTYPEWVLFFERALSREQNKRPEASELLKYAPKSPISSLSSQRILSHYQSVFVDKKCGETAAVESKTSVPATAKFIPILILVSILLPNCQTRTLPLLPAFRLSITSMPWAEVLIDGNSRGFTPVYRTALRAGLHKIEIRGKRGRVLKKSIIAFDNGRATLEVVFP